LQIRELIEDDYFQNKVETEGPKLPGFDEILRAARRYLTDAPNLSECRMVGSGAASDLRCLRSLQTPVFP
jgi:hypothetical protein